MTREEAIQVLKDTYAHWLRLKEEHLLPCSECEEVTEAIDMAISALQNEEWYMTFFNNIAESPNDVVEKNDEVIDHDREWIIGCIKHDGFIKTDRFDKANQIILDALSADTESDDLIIKNGKGIQDGLYNIKDGEIFKYKAKGGTVRAYKLVECVSAERVVRCKDCTYNSICSKSVQTTEHDKFTTTIGYKKIDFCSWAKMKGGAE